MFQEDNKNEELGEEKLLIEAHQEWLAAKRFFDFAEDPDLVDYAIYSLKAAEKKYIYLWKRMRKKMQESGFREGEW
ncbi:MAG TPA: DUF2508 domain-containing protein [Peptococcaceae bacterium]|nr:DUF2508 domain-containing protein [Peptococcaceae bacterium]